MVNTCFKCNKVTVADEYMRCSECEKEHQALAKELDSRPRTVEKKVKEKLYPIKEIKGGIEVTTWISASDAAIMGIKLPNA